MENSGGYYSQESNVAFDSMAMAELQRSQNQMMQNFGRFQLDFEEEIKEFELILQGLTRNQNGELIQTYEPLMNKKGRNYIMRKIRTWLSKITAESHFDDDNINKWCLVAWKGLVADLVAYGEDWELRNDEYTNVLQLTVFKLHSIMRAARNGGLRDVVGKVSKSVETSYVNAPDQKKKLSI